MYDFGIQSQKIEEQWAVSDVKQLGLEACTNGLIVQAENDRLKRELAALSNELKYLTNETLDMCGEYCSNEGELCRTCNKGSHWELRKFAEE